VFEVGDVIARNDHSPVTIIERWPEFLWDPYLKIRHTVYVLEDEDGKRFGVEGKSCEDMYKKVG
jgi:hypothetical protein